MADTLQPPQVAAAVRDVAAALGRLAAALEQDAEPHLEPPDHEPDRVADWPPELPT